MHKISIGYGIRGERTITVFNCEGIEPPFKAVKQHTESRKDKSLLKALAKRAKEKSIFLPNLTIGDLVERGIDIIDMEGEKDDVIDWIVFEKKHIRVYIYKKEFVHIVCSNEHIGNKLKLSDLIGKYAVGVSDSRA